VTWFSRSTRSQEMLSSAGIIDAISVNTSLTWLYFQVQPIRVAIAERLEHSLNGW